MKSLTKILFITVLITFSNSSLFGQGGFGTGNGSGKKRVKSSRNVEDIGCGFRLSLPKSRYAKSAAISHSPYRTLGQGKIGRYISGSVIFDIGCIRLDDPPRKLKKDEFISSLNSTTKNYLVDSSEYIPLPKTTANGKHIYEFKTKAALPRHIKYVLKGNRVLIFIVGTSVAEEMKKSLKLFDSVEHFSTKETAERRMLVATEKSLPQSSNIKFTQTDAAHHNLKGQVKSVRVEAEDVPILTGTDERRVRSAETYDKAGNLLKGFWFQDAGYPTSVRIYGFVDKMRVSNSESFGGNQGFGIGGFGSRNVKLPPADPRYEQKYEYQYDTSKRIIEKKVFNNRGTLSRIHKFIYKDNLMDEKRFDTDGKLIRTKRHQFDENGNVIKYEFWWYDEKDKEIETYEYKKFDRFGNWTERRVVRTIIDRGLTRKRTSKEFRKITYYEN